MAIDIKTNGIGFGNQTNKAQAAVEKSFARLSSGFRINLAADDAAGLAISDALLSQVQGYQQSIRNVGDGASLIQTADGALGSQSDALGRLRELAVEAANGTLSPSDRANLQNEAQALTQGLDQIASQTTFNGTPLLSQNGGVSIQAGPNAGQTIGVQLGASTSASLGLTGLDLTTAAGAQTALGKIDNAIANIDAQRANLGASQNQLEHAQNNLATASQNAAEAASRIKDADVAAETSDLAANQIGLQASISVAAQANLSHRLALKLLGG